MTRKPPVVATWVLEHAVRQPSAQSLTGDLVELYEAGRGRAWYWRQVVVAIGWDLVAQTRRHPVVTLRSVAVAWVGLDWGSSLAVYVHNLLVSLLVWARGPRGALEHPNILLFVIPVVGVAAMYVCGRLIARLHRAAPVTGPVVVALFIVLFVTAIGAWTGINHMIRTGLWLLALNLGAMVSNAPNTSPAGRERQA